MRCKDKEHFITKAKEFHGNTYCYSSSVYRGSKTKLTIICPLHGKFQQTPSNHYKFGCMECGLIRKAEKKTIGHKKALDKLLEKHKERYTYPNFEDLFKTSTKNHIEVKCGRHGVFKQKYDNHLSGQGCPYCRVSGQDGLSTLYLTLLHKEDEVILKIGVSSKENIQERLVNISGYNNCPLWQIRIDSRVAVLTERLIKSSIPRVNTTLCGRSGYTECFDVSYLEPTLKLLRKAVSHAFRAGYQARDIYTDGDFEYPLKEIDFIKDVKLGNLDYKTQVAPELEKLVDEVNELADNSNLPKKVDTNFWDEFILDVYLGG